MNWVDFGFLILGDGDLNRYYGPRRVALWSRYITYVTWWYRICRYCVPSLTSRSVPLFSLVCACYNITDEAGIAAAALQSVQPLGQWYSSFLRYRYYEQFLALHWLESRWRRKLQKNSTQLTGFYPLGSLTSLLLSFQQWLYQIRWETWMIWWNNTFLWMVTGWKPLTVGISSPMCRYCHLVETNLLQKQLTSFHSLLDLPCKSLSWTYGISAVVSLIFAVIYYELEVIKSLKALCTGQISVVWITSSRKEHFEHSHFRNWLNSHILLVIPLSGTINTIIFSQLSSWNFTGSCKYVANYVKVIPLLPASYFVSPAFGSLVVGITQLVLEAHVQTEVRRWRNHQRYACRFDRTQCAGIGDSLVVGCTLIPVLLGIALDFPKGGNVAEFISSTSSYGTSWSARGMRFAFFKGLIEDKAVEFRLADQRTSSS